MHFQERIQRFGKEANRPTKKILGFTRSKKAKITLETIISLRNISISIFKFSQFLYKMKADEILSNLI